MQVVNHQSLVFAWHGMRRGNSLNEELGLHGAWVCHSQKKGREGDREGRVTRLVIAHVGDTGSSC